VVEGIFVVKAIVPVASGKVIVRSAVGSPAVKVASKSFAVVPSKIIVCGAGKYIPWIVGVCPVSVIVGPLIVGVVKTLLDNVCVVSVPTTVVVASGNVIVRSAVGSTTVRVVSNELSVAPSNIIEDAGITAFLSLFNPTTPFEAPMSLTIT
jgi:hypothetical protein